MGKSKNKITNWKQYNKALEQRGSITFWADDSAIDYWRCTEHHGKRGRGFQYTDTAIETALMIKVFFSSTARPSRFYQFHFQACECATYLA